jgi:putative hydrolase of the HAD superfamily
MLNAMKPRAIFFDMDDTLLDGVTAMNAAWETVCADAAPGCPCEPAHLRDAIRREGAKFWADEAAVGHWRLDLDGARALVVKNALAAEGFDTARATEIATTYARLHREHLRPFEDAVPTLELLRAAGFRLGLLTNGPRPLQRDKIERFGFEQYFDVIVIEGEFGHGKPEREVFGHALTTVGAEAAEAWHIGDNLYADIAGAQSVGIHAAWIHRDRLELKENGPAVPDRIVAHLGEVTAALGIDASR